MAAAFYASSAQAMPKKPDCKQSYTPRLCLVHSHVKAVRWFNLRTGRRLPHYRWLPERQVGRRDHWVAYWRSRRLVARKHYVAWTRQPWLHGSIHDALLCIHSFEGAWNDPDAPYWGGLQMDLSFMRTYNPGAYARWGTADRWPVAEQLEAGWRAVVSGRGFGPWPATRLMCGL